MWLLSIAQKVDAVNGDGIKYHIEYLVPGTSVMKPVLTKMSLPRVLVVEATSSTTTR